MSDTPFLVQEKIQLLLKRVSSALYVVAAFFLVHATAAIILAEPAKRTPGVLVGGGILNVAVSIALILIGRRVRVGKNLTLALCLGWFLLLGAASAGAVTMAMGYEGKPLLAVVQVVFLLVQCWSVFVSTRAALFISNTGGAFGSGSAVSNREP